MAMKFQGRERRDLQGLSRLLCSRGGGIGIVLGLLPTLRGGSNSEAKPFESPQMGEAAQPRTVPDEPNDGEFPQVHKGFGAGQHPLFLKGILPVQGSKVSSSRACEEAPYHLWI